MGQAVATSESASPGLRVLLILSTLLAFASVSTDLYLPALPQVSRSVHASASMIEWTISGYLVGFSLGQLLWGPLGDRYGRRRPLAVGLLIFIAGSAGCAIASSGVEMIAWRALQAVGACAGVVLARAMVRDLFTGNRAAQMLSTLMMVMAIAPLIGPLLGGQILAHTGSWRAIFWLLTLVGGGTLLSLLLLPETLPPSARETSSLMAAFPTYGSLLRHRALLGYAGAGGFFYAGVFAYIAGSPFAYIEYFHVPAKYYGLLFGAGIIGIMGTNLANARLVVRLGSDRLLRIGAWLCAAAGVALCILVLTSVCGVAGMAVPIFFFVSATGLIVANSVAGALGIFPGRSGTTSALVGALQYGSGIAGSAAAGLFSDGTPRPLAIIIALTGLGTLACALWVVPRHASALGTQGRQLADEVNQQA